MNRLQAVSYIPRNRGWRSGIAHAQGRRKTVALDVVQETCAAAVRQIESSGGDARRDDGIVERLNGEWGGESARDAAEDVR